MHNKGFTLTELLVTVTMLAFVGLFLFLAMTSSVSGMAVSKAKDQVQGEVRELIDLMVREIEIAPKKPVGAAAPLPTGVSPVRIINGTNPEIVFQVPRATDGETWSNPIRFRFITEDSNDNDLLDIGEDTDLDGLLTRRILRVEDRNGDGDTTDDGETVIVGAANNITQCVFGGNMDGLTGDVLSMVTISVTASTPVVGSFKKADSSTVNKQTIASTETCRILLMN